MTFQRTFERIEGGTQVTMRYGGKPPFLVKLFMPLLVIAGKRALRGDFRRLKELMEGDSNSV
jgi:hypothetical protein